MTTRLPWPILNVILRLVLRTLSKRNHDPPWMAPDIDLWEKTDHLRQKKLFGVEHPPRKIRGYFGTMHMHYPQNDHKSPPLTFFEEKLLTSVGVRIYMGTALRLEGY